MPITLVTPSTRGGHTAGAADAARADPLSGIGYRTIGPIAAGAFSTIVRARHAHTGAEVAIKSCEHTRTAKGVQLVCERELDVLSRIQKVSSPWIANMVEAHSSPQATLVVLELCGSSLQRQLAKLRSRADTVGLPHADAAHLGSQIWRGLRHLHELGVAHRDLKPSNILFYGARHLKLCDFGFARRCAPSARLHTICGTPIYMAPELMKDAEYCRAGYEGFPVDVWALGCVLYELVHSTVAFNGSSHQQLAQRIKAGHHAKLRANLPKVWKAIIKSCLTIKPSKRPSIQALASCPVLVEGCRADAEGIDASTAVETASRLKAGTPSAP